MKMEMLPDERKIFWVCLLMALLSLLFIVYVIGMLCREEREWRNSLTYSDSMIKTTLVFHKHGFTIENL